MTVSAGAAEPAAPHPGARAAAPDLTRLDDAALRRAWQRSGKACGDGAAHAIAAELLRRGMPF